MAQLARCAFGRCAIPRSCGVVARAMRPCGRSRVAYMSTASATGVYDPRADENYEPPTRDLPPRPARFADFRSDTVTTPTAEMTIAMIDAVVGDDVYGEDPTVNKLQATAAQMLGKEAALFVPSGTMANLIALAAHTRRGDEVVCGDEQHVFVYEQGGASQLFGAVYHTLPQKDDGTFAVHGAATRGTLEYALASRGGGVDAHYARPRVVSLENTHNRAGGRVLPLAFIDDVATVAEVHGCVVHMDGARLMNAVAATGVAPARIVQRCASVSLCLSKGLGAPVGSVIAGSRGFIDACHRLRKVLGGGMRQAGVVAASGIVALKEHSKKLKDDHVKAKSLARGLAGVAGVVLDASKVQTNIVFFDLDTAALSTARLADKVRRQALPAEIGEGAGMGAGMQLAPAWAALDAEHVATLTPAAALSYALEKAVRVRMGAYGTGRLRAVTHHQVSDADVEAAVAGVGAIVGAMRAP